MIITVQGVGVTTAMMIAEIDRELALRKKVYPVRIHTGRLTRHKAEQQTLILVAVRGLLEHVRRTELAAGDASAISDYEGLPGSGASEKMHQRAS